MYLFIESGFYNTTKRTILKRLNGFAADLPIASSLAFAAVRAKRSRQTFAPIHIRRENAYAL